MKRLYWVLFIVLLLTPIVVNFVFISYIHAFAQKISLFYRFASANVLLRDILFVEGALLLVFGAQSGEYVWNYFRNWKKMREEHSYPTELMVGLALLTFGTVYVLVAILLPEGII